MTIPVMLQLLGGEKQTALRRRLRRSQPCAHSAGPCFGITRLGQHHTQSTLASHCSLRTGVPSLPERVAGSALPERQPARRCAPICLPAKELIRALLGQVSARTMRASHPGTGCQAGKSHLPPKMQLWSFSSPGWLQKVEERGQGPHGSNMCVCCLPG